MVVDEQEVTALIDLGAQVLSINAQFFLDFFGTLGVNLYSHFATYVFEALTETIGVWDH